MIFKIQFLPHGKHNVSITKTNQLTLFREIVVDYSDHAHVHAHTHTHIHNFSLSLSGQNDVFLMLKQSAHIRAVTSLS